MNRRTALALAGSVPPALFVGCLGRLPFTGLDPVDLPEWPDEPTEAAVTSYAARYRVVEVHNRAVAQQDDDWYYRELSHGVYGAFEAKTSAGFVVMTSGGGGGTSVHGLSRNELSGEIILPSEALLVSENEVIQAPVDDRWEDLDDPSDPPFSTRGLSLVNFSTENRRVDVSIENSEDSNGPLFAETYDLDAEHGRTELEVLDGPGEYEVSVSTDEGGATHQWSVSENPRELTEPYVGGTHDVGLGIYVLPDGAVEIHEVPEGRTTERERIRQESLV